MAGTYVLTFIVLTLQARKNMPAAFYTSLALGAAIFAVFAYGVLTMPHVHARLESMLYGTSYTVQATKAVIHSSSLIGSNPESIQTLTNLPDVPTDFMFAGIVGKMGYLMGHWSLCCTYGHRYQYTEPHKTQASLESCWGLVSLPCSFWDSSGT